MAMFALMVETVAMLLALVGFIAAAATEVNYIRNHRSFSGERPRPAKKEVAVVAAE
jgi:uncharacterized membrane protein YidH (DUF202 family)